MTLPALSQTYITCSPSRWQQTHRWRVYPDQLQLKPPPLRTKLAWYLTHKPNTSGEGKPERRKEAYANRGSCKLHTERPFVQSGNRTHARAYTMLQSAPTVLEEFLYKIDIFYSFICRYLHSFRSRVRSPLRVHSFRCIDCAHKQGYRECNGCTHACMCTHTSSSILIDWEGTTERKENEVN